jgi:hypothetical protein
MNSEFTQELEEEFRVLVELLSQHTVALTGMTDSINKITTTVVNANSSVTDYNNSQKKNVDAIKQNNVGSTALQKSNKRYNEIVNEARDSLIRAADLGKNALIGLYKTAISTQEGFAKYNSTISKVGDISVELGKNFGILGTAVGYLFKGFTVLLEYQTQQADNILKATDEIARMGAAGTFTAKQILDMGHGAGLTSMELEKLTGPMKSVAGGFVALGGTTSEGIKKFGEVVAVSEDVRREFKRLGMGDKERNQSLADFVTLMNKSGTAFRDELSSSGGVQQAALQYARQMYVLADVSGMSVEEAKKKYEAQMSTLETALYQNKMEQDRIAAQKAYDNADTAEERAAASAKLEKIKKDKAGYLAFNNALMQAGVGPEQVAAAQRQYFTGYIDGTSAQFAQWGVDLDSLIVKAKSGELDSGEAAQEIKTGFQTTVNNLGQTTVALDQQTAKNMGLGIDMIRRTTQQSETDYKKELQDAVGKITGNQYGVGKVAEDPAQEARNDLTEAERALRITADSFIADLNPLLGNTGLLKGLGIAAASATAIFLAIAAFKLGSAGVGLVKKIGTSPSSGVKGVSRTDVGIAAVNPIEKADDASFATKAGKAEDTATKGLQLASEPKSSVAAKFLLFITEGLAGFGAVAVPMTVGSLKLSVAILAVGAAVAAANVIIGKVTIPYIAKGMSRFENLDGPKIQLMGQAIASLGLAFAIGSGSSLLASLDFFNGIKGGEKAIDDINQQVLTLQELEIDKDQFKNNLDALIAFSTALFLGNAASSKLSSATAASNIVKGVSSFFNVRPPLSQVVYFSHLDLNVKGTKKNAESFKLFSEAMSSYKGMGSGLDSISSSLGEAAFKYFNSKPPLEQFVEFSNQNIDEKKVENDATAFTNFVNAMASYRPGPGFLDSISSLLTGGTSYFNKGGPVYKFEEFANKDFVKDKKTGEFDTGLLEQYASDVGTEAFIGESPVAPIVDDVVEAGKDVIDAGKDAVNAATSFLGGLVDAAILKLKPKNVTLGPAAFFDVIDKTLLGSFFLAAKDFGKPISINSAYRSDPYQAQIWVRGRILKEKGIYTPARPKNTTTITYKGKSYTVDGSGKGSKHGRGEAIDMSTDRTAFDPYLAKYGLHRPFKKDDAPHVQLKAKDGGVFTGPGSGYPVELHGSEIIVPMNPDSVLMKLSQLESDNLDEQELEDILMGKQNDNRNFELYSQLVSQLDQVYWMIDSTTDIDKKMLKEQLY